MSSGGVRLYTIAGSVRIQIPASREHDQAESPVPFERQTCGQRSDPASREPVPFSAANLQARRRLIHSGAFG